MGRAFRERPRVVVARLLAVIVLLGAGVLIGLALSGGDPERKTPASVQQRVDRLERQVRENDTAAAALEKSQGAQKRTAARSAALRKRLRSAAARERRLRAALRRARR